MARPHHPTETPAADPAGAARFATAANTAMIVVTASEGAGGNAGCLVGFHSQASISPWRHMVMLSTANHTHRTASGASHLAVHLLGAQTGLHLAELFGAHTADDGFDKFTRCRWHPSPYGPPILDDAAGWFVGMIIDRMVAGDHEAFVIEPVDSDFPDPLPALLRYGDVQHLEPGHDAD